MADRTFDKTRDALIVTREPVDVLQLEADVVLTELTPEDGGTYAVRWWANEGGRPAVVDRERAQPGSQEHRFWTELITLIKARRLIPRVTGGR